MSGRTIATWPAARALPQVKIGSIEGLMATPIALDQRARAHGERTRRASHSGAPRAASQSTLARLSMGASVGSYHAVLVACQEQGTLERRARRTGSRGREALVPLRSEASEPPRNVHRWEDDGGSIHDESSGIPAPVRDSSPPPPL